MSAATKFLESVSVSNTSVMEDEAGFENIEDVSITDAIHATKIAVLEFALKLREVEPNHMRAMIEDKIRQLNREHVKV